MINSKTLTMMITTACLLGSAFYADAHRAWIKPNKTVLSGDKNYVTFDAAVSNTIFVPEHVAFRTSGIQVTAPDGSLVSLENEASGKYRSTFDVQLKQQGTYRIATASAGLRASWKDEDGKRKRWPGRGQQASAEDFAKQVPKQATDLQISYSARRIETFVTLGAPSQDVLTPSNKGLELVPISHPNDLFATEQANFKFLIDGEPAVGVEIEVVKGSMRYRNDSETITLKTDKNGEFSVTWPQAGMYFLEASYKDDKAQAPATSRSGGYSATLEVLPL